MDKLCSHVGRVTYYVTFVAGLNHLKYEIYFSNIEILNFYTTVNILNIFFKNYMC